MVFNYLKETASKKSRNQFPCKNSSLKITPNIIKIKIINTMFLKLKLCLNFFYLYTFT